MSTAGRQAPGLFDDARVRLERYARITENISEIQEKKKRGRPLAWVGRDKAGPDIASGKTKRHQANISYSMIAMAALRERPAFAWLVPSFADIMSGKGKVKMTVIGVLGRLGLEEDIQAVAQTICEERMSTQAALHYIREVRFGQRLGSVDALASALVVTLNEYMARHELQWDAVELAVTVLRAAVTVSASESLDEEDEADAP